MRLLILLGIIYLAYRVLKFWISAETSSKTKVYRSAAGEIDDVMVKDPFCEVYFPKRNGVHLKFEGNDLYFCSSECRNKYVAERSGE